MILLFLSYMLSRMLVVCRVNGTCISMLFQVDPSCSMQLLCSSVYMCSVVVHWIFLILGMLMSRDIRENNHLYFSNIKT